MGSHMYQDESEDCHHPLLVKDGKSNWFAQCTLNHTCRSVICSSTLSWLCFARSCIAYHRRSRFNTSLIF